MVRDSEGFLYPLEAVLMHKAGLTEPKQEKPTRIFVVSRMSEYCHGGRQNFYTCRMLEGGSYTGHISKELMRFSENELIPHALPNDPNDIDAALTSIRRATKEFTGMTEEAMRAMDDVTLKEKK